MYCLPIDRKLRLVPAVVWPILPVNVPAFFLLWEAAMINSGIARGYPLFAIHAQRIIQKFFNRSPPMVLLRIDCIDGAHSDNVPPLGRYICRGAFVSGIHCRLRFAGKRTRRRHRLVVLVHFRNET